MQEKIELFKNDYFFNIKKGQCACRDSRISACYEYVCAWPPNLHFICDIIRKQQRLSCELLLASWLDRQIVRQKIMFDVYKCIIITLDIQFSPVRMKNRHMHMVSQKRCGIKFLSCSSSRTFLSALPIFQLSL